MALKIDKEGGEGRGRGTVLGAGREFIIQMATARSRCILSVISSVTTFYKCMFYSSSKRCRAVARNSNLNARVMSAQLRPRCRNTSTVTRPVRSFVFHPLSPKLFNATSDVARAVPRHRDHVQYVRATTTYALRICPGSRMIYRDVHCLRPSLSFPSSHVESTQRNMEMSGE